MQRKSEAYLEKEEGKDTLFFSPRRSGCRYLFSFSLVRFSSFSFCFLFPLFLFLSILPSFLYLLLFFLLPFFLFSFSFLFLYRSLPSFLFLISSLTSHIHLHIGVFTSLHVLCKLIGLW